MQDAAPISGYIFQDTTRPRVALDNYSKTPYFCEEKSLYSLSGCATHRITNTGSRNLNIRAVGSGDILFSLPPGVHYLDTLTVYMTLAISAEDNPDLLGGSVTVEEVPTRPLPLAVHTLPMRTASMPPGYFCVHGVAGKLTQDQPMPTHEFKAPPMQHRGGRHLHEPECKQYTCCTPEGGAG
jgi:hypothetical protein